MLGDIQTFRALITRGKKTNVLGSLFSTYETEVKSARNIERFS